MRPTCDPKATPARAKSEIRRPKSEGNPKPEIRTRNRSGSFFRTSDFALPSDFGLRSSDFRVLQQPHFARPRADFSPRHPRRLWYNTLKYMNKDETRPIEILLVEDSPSDTELTIEALRDFKVRNHVSIVEDGVLAMQFLRREGPYAQAPRPDLILLDLNLPRKDGREVLAEIKSNEHLKTIPVVVLTTSRADQDILRSYQLNANCYINKPVDFNQFLEVVRSIEAFWLYVVTLPPGSRVGGG